MTPLYSEDIRERSDAGETAVRVPYVPRCA